jgi:predicted dehydrogenase
MIKLGIIGQPLPIISHLPAPDHLSEITWTGFFSANAYEPEDPVSFMPQAENAESLIENADALIIAEDKSEYYNLAVTALKHARHLFLPVTLVQTTAEANKLIKLANEANVILKVHMPGIFPADFKKQFAFNGDIWLIELHHYANITEENPGQRLFYNLLYNLDFILGMTRSNVVSMKATGLNMLSPGVDIVNTRIDFDNGCSATVTCNCASVKDEHVGTIVLKDKIMRIDFIREDAVVWNIMQSDQINGTITTDKLSLQHGNDLTASLLSFITQLNDKNRTLANPEDGFKSFILTTRIMDRVNKNTVRSA